MKQQFAVQPIQIGIVGLVFPTQNFISVFRYGTGQDRNPLPSTERL
jgi:hypothetical protein